MVKSVRKPGRKNPSTETIETFGYVDVLKVHYADPIAYFTEYVAEKNRQEELESAEYTIITKRTKRLIKIQITEKWVCCYLKNPDGTRN